MVVEVCGDIIRQPVDIIAHQTNCNGIMNEDISKMIREHLLTTQEYSKYVNKCRENGTLLLGQTQLLEAPDGRIIANCFFNNVPARSARKFKEEDFNDILHSIAKVRNHARPEMLSVAIPGMIGCENSDSFCWKYVRGILYELFGKKNEPSLTICYADEKEYLKWNNLN